MSPRPPELYDSDSDFSDGSFVFDNEIDEVCHGGIKNILNLFLNRFVDEEFHQKIGSFFSES